MCTWLHAVLAPALLAVVLDVGAVWCDTLDETSQERQEPLTLNYIIEWLSGKTFRVAGQFNTGKAELLQQSADIVFDLGLDSSATDAYEGYLRVQSVVTLEGAVQPGNFRGDALFDFNSEPDVESFVASSRSANVYFLVPCDASDTGYCLSGSYMTTAVSYGERNCSNMGQVVLGVPPPLPDTPACQVGLSPTTEAWGAMNCRINLAYASTSVPPPIQEADAVPPPPYTTSMPNELEGDAVEPTAYSMPPPGARSEAPGLSGPSSTLAEPLTKEQAPLDAVPQVECVWSDVWQGFHYAVYGYERWLAMDPEEPVPENVYFVL